MRKIRSTSFASELTPVQRDDLFAALSDGLSYKDAASKVHEWLRENSAVRRLGFPVVHRVRQPATSAICGWYRSVVADQRYAAVQAALRSPLDLARGEGGSLPPGETQRPAAAPRQPSSPTPGLMR